MAIGYVALPQYRTPEPLDFSALSSAFDDLAKSRERNRLLDEAKQIGASLQPAAQGSTTQPINRLMATSTPAQYQAGGVVDRIIGAESGGRANVTNPRSSAAGAGQFINSTWLDVLKRNRPDLADGKSDAELLALRTDPNLSREMTSAYAAENAKGLQGAGFEATPGNTYLAHFAGPAGARAVLSANPSASARSVLGDRVVQANPFLANMNAGDVVNWAGRKMGGASAPAQPSAPAASSGLNYAAGIQTALRQGNLSLAMQLQNAQQEAENQTYTRGRQAVQDAQAAETHELSTQQARDTLQKNFTSRVGAIAQTIQSEPDPAKKQAMWQRFIAADPRFTQALRAYGVDPSDVEAGTRALIAEARGLESKPQVGRFRPSKQGIVDTVTGQLVPGSAAADAEAPEYGTSPQYFRDKDGNLRIGQLSKAGGMKSVDLPEGATVLPGIDYRDMGTFVEGRDKRTGQVVSTRPKDITGKESAEEVGKARGLALNAMPAAKTTVDNAFQTIGKLRTHPGLDVGTGASNVFDPRSWIPGTNAYDFQAMNKQAQGQSFMAAREALKGAGQVTDFEGAKGEQAIANLDTAQSREQYLAALDTLERMMQASYDDLQRKAGILPSPATSPPPDQSLPTINTPEEADALPPGTRFRTPDGRIKTRP